MPAFLHWMIYWFGSLELNVRHGTLWRDGKPVRLEPVAFEILRYLIEHRDRIVTKHELG